MPRPKGRPSACKDPGFVSSLDVVICSACSTKAAWTEQSAFTAIPKGNMRHDAKGADH